MATSEANRRRLKALRRKYGLGEFAKGAKKRRNGGSKARSSTSRGVTRKKVQKRVRRPVRRRSVGRTIFDELNPDVPNFGADDIISHDPTTIQPTI